MLPLPSLSGSGGGSQSGDARNQAGFSSAFGSFQVGGRGNSGQGGTASTPTAGDAPPPWLYLGIGAAALLVLGLFGVVLMRRR